MANKKLFKMLDALKAKYKLITHKTVYTAYDAAQTQKLPLKQVGKTLLVKADNKFAIVLLPASKRLNIQKVKKGINLHLAKIGQKKAKSLTICNEKQIINNFTKGRGAMTPFGSLYGCLSIVDKGFLKNKTLSLNAGSFEESITLSPAVYKKIEKPIEFSIAK